MATAQWLQPLSTKNQVCQFATPRKGTEGLALNTHDSHIDFTLPIRLIGVDDLCLRLKSGNVSFN